MHTHTHTYTCRTHIQGLAKCKFGRLIPAPVLLSHWPLPTTKARISATTSRESSPSRIKILCQDEEQYNSSLFIKAQPNLYRYYCLSPVPTLVEVAELAYPT